MLSKAQTSYFTTYFWAVKVLDNSISLGPLPDLGGMAGGGGVHNSDIIRILLSWSS